MLFVCFAIKTTQKCAPNDKNEYNWQKTPDCNKITVTCVLKKYWSSFFPEKWLAGPLGLPHSLPIFAITFFYAAKFPIDSSAYCNVHGISIMALLWVQSRNLRIFHYTWQALGISFRDIFFSGMQQHTSLCDVDYFEQLEDVINGAGTSSNFLARGGRYKMDAFSQTTFSNAFS